ncbi:MAG: hypothetical protein JKX92_10195 [Porticoccaceae bacterium]|nr:hypothetical protein [Porticoccaceae bacterium]
MIATNTGFGRLQFILLLVLWGSATPLWAGDLSVSVIDDQGELVENAVVVLHPLFDDDWSTLEPQALLMKQQGAMFRPFVLAVGTASTVSFPNFDEFRHQVYSYSKAKRIELRLYGMDESKTVLFDRAGIVALGCNIHDNMLAYIYVSDEPYHVVSDAQGMALIRDVRPGDYEMTIWHPDQKKRRQNYMQSLSVLADSAAVAARIEMRSSRRQQKSPASAGY